MKKVAQLATLVLTFLLSSSGLNCFACSMCKVTINGRTYLGSNEDSWRPGSTIWFENKTFGNYGAVYVGYGDGFPQGGMNEAGVAFDGLTIYLKSVKLDPDKKTVTNPSAFIKEIMQTCQTVEDVKKYASQFNRQPFNSSVLMFSDKSGKYLVIEPDTMIIGNDNKYIIANFCPSSINDDQKMAFARYERGNIFLQNHINDTNSNYSFALTDTMHECRNKIGDGTMYSFVADLNNGNFNLFFYHDFKISKDFNLKTELSKGDHKFKMPDIFPLNSEYKRFLSFQTPHNNGWMRLILICFAGLFAFSSIFLLASFIRDKNTISKKGIKLFLTCLNLILLYYCFVLKNNQSIFYFPSPYQDSKFSLLNVAAYIPFLLLVSIIPLFWQNIKIVKGTSWSKFSKFIFSLNLLAYLTLIGLFAYWKLYSIF